MLRFLPDDSSDFKKEMTVEISHSDGDKLLSGDEEDAKCMFCTTLFSEDERVD
jgi:hypothetical protein